MILKASVLYAENAARREVGNAEPTNQVFLRVVIDHAQPELGSGFNRNRTPSQIVRDLRLVLFVLPTALVQ